MHRGISTFGAFLLYLYRIWMLLWNQVVVFVVLVRLLYIQRYAPKFMVPVHICAAGLYVLVTSVCVYSGLFEVLPLEKSPVTYSVIC